MNQPNAGELFIRKKRAVRVHVFVSGGKSKEKAKMAPLQEQACSLTESQEGKDLMRFVSGTYSKGVYALLEQQMPTEEEVGTVV